MSTVVIENLRKKFGDSVVLHNFNLTVKDGEFIVLLGPSGCGKTTVLRCLAGLEEPTGGRITIGTQTVEDTGRGVSLPTQKRDLGLVFQSYALWPHMTVFENVAYPLRMRRVPRQQVSAKVSEILSLVGLDGFEERGSMELSGGQQQRVALARALVASPQVLLLDEPLSNLDAQRRNALRKQLRAIHREVGTTTIYVTHDQIEALTMADRVLVMRSGAVEQNGTPQEVFERPASRFVANFLGYENIFSGRAVSAGPDSVVVDSQAFAGPVRIASPLRVPEGETVDLAFRASNVVVSTTSREAEPQAPNTIGVRVNDVTYLGDTLEYNLGLGAHSFVARVPASAGPSLGTAGDGRALAMSVAPEHIVLLPRKEAPASQAGGILEHSHS